MNILEGDLLEIKNESPDVRPAKRSVSLVQAIGAAVLVAIVAFVVGTRSDVWLAQMTGTKVGTLDLSSVQSLYETLNNKYEGQLDTQKLIDGAKHGLVEASGDPYTVYFTADEAKAFDDGLEGTFEGIGAELAKVNSQLAVQEVLGDSPAQKAGIKSGDVIVRVNDEDTSDLSVSDAVKKIRGKKGTSVKLTIVRGEDAAREVSITRDTINDPSVKTEITADNIGIMRISRFGETDTVRLARAAAQDFKDRKVRAVVVDLRGNGGGYLSAAQDIASLWLNDKVVVTERRGGAVTDTLRSGTSAILEGVPTVVLIDGGSASASEILAGALKDNGAARLVGVKSFGKGSVQSIEHLTDGGQLKVTVAKWYTPNGKNISKEGIEPDIKVIATEEDITAGRDLQREKALELFK